MEPRSSKTNSRKMFIAVTNFTPTQAGELSLAEGDLVESKCFINEGAGGV